MAPSNFYMDPNCGRARQVLIVSNFNMGGRWQLQLQVPTESGCGQNLKKLEIYDIIKVETFLRAQKTLGMSNFAFRANLCYNIYVR